MPKSTTPLSSAYLASQAAKAIGKLRSGEFTDLDLNQYTTDLPWISLQMVENTYKSGLLPFGRDKIPHSRLLEIISQTLGLDHYNRLLSKTPEQIQKLLVDTSYNLDRKYFEVGRHKAQGVQFTCGDFQSKVYKGKDAHLKALGNLLAQDLPYGNNIFEILWTRIDGESMDESSHLGGDNFSFIFETLGFGGNDISCCEFYIDSYREITTYWQSLVFDQTYCYFIDDEEEGWLLFTGESAFIESMRTYHDIINRRKLAEAVEDNNRHEAFKIMQRLSSRRQAKYALRRWHLTNNEEFIRGHYHHERREESCDTLVERAQTREKFFKEVINDFYSKKRCRDLTEVPDDLIDSLEISDKETLKQILNLPKSQKGRRIFPLDYIANQADGSKVLRELTSRYGTLLEKAELIGKGSYIIESNASWHQITLSDEWTFYLVDGYYGDEVLFSGSNGYYLAEERYWQAYCWANLVTGLHCGDIARIKMAAAATGISFEENLIETLMGCSIKKYQFLAVCGLELSDAAIEGISYCDDKRSWLKVIERLGDRFDPEKLFNLDCSIRFKAFLAANYTIDKKELALTREYASAEVNEDFEDLIKKAPKTPKSWKHY